MPNDTPSGALHAGVWKQRPVKFETIKKLGLDPDEHSTCAPGKCRQWARCRVKERFEKPNPRTLGITLFKPLVGSRDKKTGKPKMRPINLILDCIHIPDATSQAIENGGDFIVVAQEGENIKLPYSKRGEMEPGAAFPKQVRSFKEFVVPPYNDGFEAMIEDQIETAKLEKAQAESEAERHAELKKLAGKGGRSSG